MKASDASDKTGVVYYQGKLIEKGEYQRQKEARLAKRRRQRGEPDDQQELRRFLWISGGRLKTIYKDGKLFWLVFRDDSWLYWDKQTKQVRARGKKANAFLDRHTNCRKKPMLTATARNHKPFSI
jgi:hypothetical protein